MREIRAIGESDEAGEAGMGGKMWEIVGDCG
jgi:hypothetical protein